MKLVKSMQVMALAVLCSGSFTCTENAMYAEVDGVLHEVLDSFDGDIALYNKWALSLNGVMAQFDIIDGNRQTFFDTIRQTIERLSAEIESLVSDAEDKDSTIDELEMQMIGMQADHSAEIANLQSMIAELQLQLQQAEQAYANLSDQNEEKAIALVDSLNDLKQRYYSLVGHRTNFLSSLEMFQNRVKRHFNALSADEESVMALLPEGYVGSSDVQ